MIVVDTSALIAIMRREPERDRFLALIRADEGPLISVVSILEATMVSSRALQRGAAEGVNDFVSELGLRPAPVTLGQIHIAGGLFRAWERPGRPASAQFRRLPCVRSDEMGGRSLALQGRRFRTYRHHGGGVMWRERDDLWNGVVQIRYEANLKGAPAFIAFFIVAGSREDAARKLSIELSDKGWCLVPFVNPQNAPDIDDEAAEHLAPMAIIAEEQGVSFSDFREPPARIQ